MIVSWFEALSMPSKKTLPVLCSSISIDLRPYIPQEVEENVGK